MRQLKQTKEWDRCPNRLRHRYKTLLPENLGKHCAKNGQQAKRSQEVKFLIQKDSKPQDFIVYIEGSVTKDQSGWDFTVKQGATTIHEDSTAYTVSSSSLTMEGEIVTHGICWIASKDDSRTTHAIILTD